MKRILTTLCLGLALVCAMTACSKNTVPDVTPSPSTSVAPSAKPSTTPSAMPSVTPDTNGTVTDKDGVIGNEPENTTTPSTSNGSAIGDVTQGVGDAMQDMGDAAKNIVGGAGNAARDMGRDVTRNTR